MKLPQPRVLPIAIAFTILGIGMRTVNVVSYAISGTGFSTVTPASAETSPKPALQPSGGPDTNSGKGDMTKMASAEPPPAAPPNTAHMTPTAPDENQQAADLLTTLNQKRKDLDARAQELDQREALLKAAEERIDKKVDELSGMRTDLEKLLDLQKSKDDAQIASLVKIYEDMKPKDAAAIFNTLDLPVLVDVSSRMKEAKVAPILAAMDPARARLLTVKLSDHRKVMESTVADAKAALGDTAPATPADPAQK